MLDISLIVLLILLGFLISSIASMVGLGGGILFIPVLILIFKIPAKNAIGISLFAITLVTLGATIGYLKRKSVNWKIAFVYNILDIPGVLLGIYFTQIIPNHILQIICGSLIITLAFLVIVKKSDKKEIKKQEGENEHDDKGYEFSLSWKDKTFKWILLSSFLGGFISGMVGLGGGTTDTTAMVLMGIPMNIAAGSSSFAMVLTSGFALGGHILLGNIQWDYALLLGIPAFFGALFGAKISKKIKPVVLRQILASIAFFTGIRLLFGI